MKIQAKSVIKCLIILVFPLVLLSFNNYDRCTGLDGFVKQIFSSYRLPKSILEDCEWNYAIMILRTNSKNQIVKVDFSNEYDISDEFKDSFQFLNGNQIPKNVKIDQRPIVLFITIEQLGGKGCSLPKRDYSPSMVAQKILMNLEEQLKREPNSIVSYKPITLVAGGQVN